MEYALLYRGDAWQGLLFRKDVITSNIQLDRCFVSFGSSELPPLSHDVLAGPLNPGTDVAYSFVIFGETHS
jgi:hypothetical protein